MDSSKGLQSTCPTHGKTFYPERGESCAACQHAAVIDLGEIMRERDEALEEVEKLRKVIQKAIEHSEWRTRVQSGKDTFAAKIQPLLEDALKGGE